MDSNVFDITLPPGGAQRISTRARYIRFLDGTAGGADTTVLVQSIGGGVKVQLKPGQAFRIDSYADDWLISNYSGQGTIIGALLIGDVGFEDGRISGSVEVIDGGKARTLAGVAFLGNGYQAPVAGQLAYNQLYNPVGSGKNAIIEQVWWAGHGGAASGSYAGIRMYQGQLATLIGPATSKKAGGALSVMQIRTATGVASLGVGLTGMLLGQVYKFTEPLVIPAGWSILMQTNDPAMGLQASFEFYEEPA